jgi:Fe-S-cluster-containing hydrogenase component 2
MPAVVNEASCEGCEACVSACPTGVITMVDAKAKIGADCVDCGGCVDACPCGAISMA